MFAAVQRMFRTVEPAINPVDDWPGNVVPAITDLIALRRQSWGLPLFPVPASASQAGRHSSRARGRGMDFEESRPYQPGDDIRTIDWRVTARTTRTHTKVFREERERPVYILVDLRHTMFLGSTEMKSVCAAKVAAALAWATLQRGDRIGGIVFNDSSQRDIRPRRSRHEVLRLIRALHELAPRQPDAIQPNPLQPLISLADMMGEMVRTSGTGGSVFIISDFHDRDAHCDRHWHRLARHHQVTPIFVYDRLEQQLPPPGSYPVGDGERVLQLQTDQPRERQHFEQHFQMRAEQLARQAVSLQGQLLHCPTGSEVPALLKQHFGGRGRSPLS